MKQVSIPQFVAINMFQYYPKRVLVVPIEDDTIGRWSAAVYKVSADGESLEEVLFELGHYENRSRLGAMEEMQFLLKKAMQAVTTMMN